MSKVVDYMFNGISRIGQDEFNYTQENLSNNNYSSYLLTNLNQTNEKGALDFLTNNPTMNLKSTNQVGPYGYNIDQNTKLLNSKLTNLNYRINLQERTFKTVPYLGKGNVDVGLEHSLKLGDTFKDKKSVCKLGEECQQNVEKYPLQDRVRNNISNPSKKIEENAVKGWIRGGISSREIYKNNEYQCN